MKRYELSQNFILISTKQKIVIIKYINLFINLQKSDYLNTQ